MIKPLILKDFIGIDARLTKEDGPDNILLTCQNAWRSKPGTVAARPVYTRLTFEQYVVANGSTKDHLVVLAQFIDTHGFHRIMGWNRGIGRGAGAGGSFAGGGFFEVHNRNLFGTFLIDEHSTVGNKSVGRPGILAYHNALYWFPGEEGSANAFITDYVFGSRPGGLPGLYDIADTTVFAFTLSSGATLPSRPSLAMSFRDSVCLAGFRDPEGSRIRFCQVGDISTLLTDAKALDVSPGDGGRIVHMAEVPVIGGSNYVESYAFVWKKNSVFMLQGNPPTSSTLGTISVTPVNKTEGMIAKETLAFTQFGPAWCSGKSVWLAPYGGQPVDIGAQIRPLLEKMPQVDGGNWHAVYFNGIYRLSVPLAFPYNTTFTTSSHQGPDCMQFWCDLREGVEKATWYGPMYIPAQAELAVDAPNGESYLLGLGAVPDESDFSLARLDFWLLDQNGKDDVTSVYSLPGVSFGLRTREFDFGDPHVLKTLDAIELELQAPTGCTLQVKVLINGGQASRSFVTQAGMGGADFTYSLTPTDAEGNTPGALSGLVPEGFILNDTTFGKLDTSDLIERFRKVTLYPTDGLRCLGNSFQVDISSSAGNGIKIRSIGLRVFPVGNRRTI